MLTPQTQLPVDRETGAALAEVIFPPTTHPDFPLLDPQLQEATLSIVVEWREHEKLRDAGVMPPTSCLLYGPPGTGKTRIALAMAARLGLPVVLARLDGVISSFLGTTGRNVANLFGFANRYNCLLLLDEFDAIAKVRDDPHEVGEIKRVVNAILQNIDSRKNRGLTIAITNHEQLLDSAVWRRFDVRIAIPPPAFLERVKIAARYFEMGEGAEPTLRFIGWLSEGMTGADMEVMAKILRRYRALHPNSTLLDALRHYSATQAGRNNLRHQLVLKTSAVQLAKEMANASELALTQKEIGSILGASQTQVGRWIKDAA